jgi:predicted ATPase
MNDKASKNQQQQQQLLFGRKFQEQQLQAWYHRRLVGRRGGDEAPPPELCLVTGVSGTGKTTLCESLILGMDDNNLVFLSGKFDQLRQQNNVPYAPFVAAFSEWASDKLLLDNHHGHYAERIRRDLEQEKADDGGSSSMMDRRLLVDTIPALEHVLGVSSKESSSSLSTSSRKSTSSADMQRKRRFLLAFRAFVRVICSPEYPLVLFLDDLQWADQGSLDLLATLVDDASNPGFLLLGACRGNEVSIDDPLSVTLRALEDGGVTITDIRLDNLSKEDVEEVVSSLLPDRKDKKQLAEALFEQTQGNLFYLQQMIKRLRLHENSTRQSMEEAETSNWSIQDVIREEMELLSENSKSVIRTASCLGASFRERHLSLALPKVDIRLALREAVEEELVYFNAMTGRGKFAHDRIQEAAYSLIPRKASFHCSLGRKLLHGMSEQELDHDIFLVVNQLGLGIEEIKQREERDRVALLCLQAGRKAAHSSAFGAAASYFDLGIRLLDERSHWRDQYYLSLALYNAAAEVEYCNGRFDQTATLLDEIFRNGRVFDDLIQAHTTEVYSLGAQGRFREAIQKGLQVLRQLGESFPLRPTKLGAMSSILKTKWMLRGKTNDDILNLPMMTDENKLAALRLLYLIYLYVFFSQQEYVPLVATRLVQRTLQYGLSGMGSAGFGTYAMLLSVLGDIDGAYKYCQITLRLLERTENRKVYLTRCYVPCYGMVLHWKQSVRDNLQPLREAHSAGMASGDIEFAMLAATLYGMSAGFCGTPIPRIQKELREFAAEMRAYKQDGILALLVPTLQIYANYMGESEHLLVLSGEFIDQDEYLAAQEASNNITAIATLHVVRCQLCYTFGELDLALDGARKSRNMSKVAGSSIGVAFQIFFDGLVCAALARQNGKSQRQRNHLVKQARRCLKRLQGYARNAPQNFLMHSLLVEAEVTLAQGRFEDAKPLYDRSISWSNKEGFLHVEAMGYELLGMALRARGEDANEYLRRSSEIYDQYGSFVKAQQLRALIAE